MISPLNVSEKDSKIIEDVVNVYFREGTAQIKIQLMRIFAQDINVDHFIIMGALIGVKMATDIKQPKNYQYERYN